MDGITVGHWASMMKERSVKREKIEWNNNRKNVVLSLVVLVVLQYSTNVEYVHNTYCR